MCNFEVVCILAGQGAPYGPLVKLRGYSHDMARAIARGAVAGPDCTSCWVLPVGCDVEDLRVIDGVLYAVGDGGLSQIGEVVT